MADREYIAWRCEECHFPIENFRGALSAPFEQIAGDGEIRWSASHYTCQPDPGYDIDVSELRTPHHAIWWTRHLMSKGWFPRSTWEDVLTRALDCERKGA